ncbi:hypothetical protein FE783_31625 [Paenibacillus mesophilus]|uniref:NosD domain-containing protein n=1 Tax=Paenibacillus mesophilus TaxID=2582849 RepID=UPI00110F069E|nr:right-handed parallel beta-helix repeat-containing protein [Paenibacillus mesophilus]TMV44709.1 hypothetical protein FE783_31625 [Paenibacillus mesophilus]
MDKPNNDHETVVESDCSTEKSDGTAAKDDGWMSRRTMLASLGATGALVAAGSWMHALNAKAAGEDPLVLIGDLSQLTTTDKSDLVHAINENVGRLEALRPINVLKPPAPLAPLVGDGVTDDTAAFQAILNYAATNKCSVFCPGGKTYLVSSIRIKNGTVALRCEGVIKGKGTAVNGVVQLDGPRLFGGTAVENCTISVNIDMSGGDREAIKADACKNCSFISNRIYGFTNHATLNHYGILLWFDSNYNKIQNNHIVGYENPTQRGLLIDLIGESANFGGFFDNGNIVPPTIPCVGNIITGNTLLYGSYAVNLLAAEYTIVSNNYCMKQNHRSIYVAQASNNSVITSNELLGFLSSGVLLGYGAYKNVVTSNLMKQIDGYNTIGGEAAVNINTGAYENLIASNRIESFTNYGVYMAVNSIGNVVDGNTISRHYIAAIALENDWIRPLPADAKYSRPNYGAPIVGTAWGSKDSENNVIQNNTISACYTGRAMCAIYIAQLGPTLTTSNNVIQNNVVTNAASYAYHLYVFEETSGKLANNTLKNNSFYMTTLSKIYLSRGRKHFAQCSGNDALDTDAFTFADGDTTPSVGKGGSFAFANTAPTLVTMFDDGMNNQTIVVRLAVNTTIVYGASAIRTKGNVDITGANSNQFVTFKLLGGIWFEQSRSF